MKLLGIICTLFLLCSACLADDLMFFADDHYKAVGLPHLNASVANPVLGRGDNLLRITLANHGRLEELVPISGNGSKDDILKEMAEEMRSIDAFSITAALEDAGPVTVRSGPQHIGSLPSGSVAELEFNLSVGDEASGWYVLPLSLDFLRQADVSVSNGDSSPLLQPENLSLSIGVLVVGTAGPLRILGTKSDLVPGDRKTLMAIIENDGSDALHNCFARLVVASPFHVDARASPLGDLAPGAMAVASFSVLVDENASWQDYQLGCEISSDEGINVLSFPITLKKTGNSFWNLAVPLLGMLIVSVFVFQKRRDLIRRLRRRR